MSATELSCLLSNAPTVYGTDVSPEQLGVLAEHDNLHAVTDSSGDVRRVAAIRETLGDRLAVLASPTDAIFGAIQLGAVGWIAGLANAFPIESVGLFEASRDGRSHEARALYEWIQPLFRLETDPRRVQLIKLVQKEVGQGNALVRPPRLEPAGDDLEQVRALICERLSCRPA